MAIKLKKATTAETTVTKTVSGKVLTEATTQELVVTPPYTEAYAAPSEKKEAIMGHVDDMHAAHQLSEMTSGAQAKAEPLVPYCEVGFEASYTHNLGNYESAKVTVTLKIPCLVPEIDEAFEYAKNWVDQKLNLVNSEIKGE